MSKMYCSKCGSEMIEGWIKSTFTDFDPQNGRKREYHYHGLVCEQIHDKTFHVTWPHGWNVHAENPTGHSAWPYHKTWPWSKSKSIEKGLYASLERRAYYVQDIR